MGIIKLIQAVFQRPTLTPDPDCGECLGKGFDAGGQMCTCVSTRPPA